jgi:NitT/TauT family transport system ATP-binding protein
MIRIRGLTKAYQGNAGQVLALDDINLEVDDREFVTLVGPSGCGKTTLLNIVAGLDHATSGAVLVDGEPVTGPNPDRGLIFQHYALFPWLTVAGNVEFGLRLTGLSRRERARVVDRYLDLVGLGAFRKAYPKELSGGMRQRCAIARAYALQPSILLMDEPFGSLDALTRIELQNDLLAAWQHERRTILFVTHDVEEAVYLANRVVVLSPRPGRIREIIPIRLPYPRTASTRLSEDFLWLRREVWQSTFPGHDQSGSRTGSEEVRTFPEQIGETVTRAAGPNADAQ